MASSKFCLIVATNEDQKTTNDLLSTVPSAGSPAGGAADAWNYMAEISDYFGKAAAGAKSLNVIYTDGLVYASGTITASGNVSNNDTVTIGGVVITFVTGTPTGSQVKIGATAAATLTALQTFINNGGSAGNLAGLVTAPTVTATALTIQAAYPGLMGNQVTLAKSAANLSVSAATLTGGSTTSYTVGISAGI